MLPNSKTRIENSLEELQGQMAEYEGTEDVEVSEEWTAAKAQVEASAAFMETIWMDVVRLELESVNKE